MIEKYKFSSQKSILFFGAILLIQNLAFAQASMESLFKQGIVLTIKQNIKKRFHYMNKL